MNILITGASRGIGFASVKEFSSRGNHNIIALSRNKTSLNELADTCNNLYPSSRVYEYCMNLESGPKDFKTLFDYIHNRFGHLDILVNNAGILINKLFHTLEMEDEIKMWKVNYLAPASLIKILMPLIGIAAKGHVVNISSMGGVQGSTKFAGLSSYSASKSALAILTECLAEEYKESNIAFNCIAIGAVQTEMLSEAFPDYMAKLKPADFAIYLVDFCLQGMNYCNGKILQFSLSQP
jgi:3-oxoacyl-[acyl-carrier protein] reductase